MIFFFKSLHSKFYMLGLGLVFNMHEHFIAFVSQLLDFSQKSMTRLARLPRKHNEETDNLLIKISQVRSHGHLDLVFLY